MVRLRVRLHLESDIVVSARAATLGGHRGLTYIPGATILGAVASQTWRTLGDDKAFRVFESGCVRFGNGYLEGVHGARSVPMPRSLHQPKDAKGSTEYRNLAVDERKADIQYVQARDGYVAPAEPTPDKEHATEQVACSRLAPRTRYTLRTAIGAEGRARDGYLYGYESIEAGQTFIANVDFDDSDDLSIVQNALADARIRLGRSRTAEFGSARVEILDPASDDVGAGLAAEQGLWETAPADAVGGRLILLCVSDLALHDPDTGVPRLTPSIADFLGNRGQQAAGRFSGWRFDAHSSFLRFRSWSPWNSERRRPDSEFQCIEAGSVIVFEPAENAGDAASLLQTIVDATRHGVGLARARGLGEVLVQPRALCAPVLEIREPVARAQAVAVAPPADDLGRWVEAQWTERERTGRIEQGVREAESIIARYGPIGPSQWGELHRLAATVSDSRELLSAVQNRVGLGQAGSPESERRAQRGVAAHRWSRKRGRKTAAQQLVDELKKVPEEDRKAFLSLLAVRRAAGERRLRERAASVSQPEGPS